MRDERIGVDSASMGARGEIDMVRKKACLADS